MTLKSKTIAAIGAVMLGTSSAAIASTVTDPAVTTIPAEDDDDGDKGLWGLAGLIGLAGLLGLKRRERDDDRRTTTTGSNRR